jgi:hypothetical protein
MGYNTTIVVMNDALDYIKRDFRFGKTLAEQISEHYRDPNGYVDVPAGGHVNAASVIAQHHADVTSVVAVGGNHGTVIGCTRHASHHLQENQVLILKELAHQLGYDLRKKPSRK